MSPKTGTNMKKIIIGICLFGCLVFPVFGQERISTESFSLAPELAARDLARVKESFTNFERVPYETAWSYFLNREGQPLLAKSVREWIELTQMRDSLHDRIEFFGNARIIHPAEKLPGLFLQISTQEYPNAFALITKSLPHFHFPNGCLIIVEVFNEKDKTRSDFELFIQPEGIVLREIAPDQRFQPAPKGFSFLIELQESGTPKYRLIYGFSSNLKPVLLRVEDEAGKMVTAGAVLKKADRLTLSSSLLFPHLDGLNANDPAIQLGTLRKLAFIASQDELHDDPENPLNDPQILNKVKELESSPETWIREASEFVSSFQIEKEKK